MEVAARNQVGAKVGDEVRVTVASKTFLKASFFVYMVPVTALILGALLGATLGPFLYPVASSDLLPVIFGLIFFLLSFVLLRIWGKGIKKDEGYCPVIAEILYGKAHLHQ
jgi:sigma-E factor negative regulatory protein RseC